MKMLIVLMTVLLTGCTEQIESTSAQNPQVNRKIGMPQDCQQYFDGLKILAKENQNLKKKFGDEIAKINEVWQSLEELDRQQFSEQCIIRNKQLQEMKGTPELEELLNEL